MKNRYIILSMLALLILAGCKPAAPVAPSETPTIIPTPIPPTETPQPSATTDPTALRFIEIPEQITIQGEAFLSLDAYAFLRFRRSSASEMNWNITGGEHVTATINDGVLAAVPSEPAWTGSETLQVEACEPDGPCATQTITYSVLEETAFNGARVTFVGNSGFLITVGDKKVLIDAFFEGFPDGYILPENVQDALVNARPPFEDIDLILATHDHADHFSAQWVRQHMQNNPDAIFISTSQAAEQLANLGERVIAADPVAGSPVQVEANGIQVEAIYLSHGTPPSGVAETFNNAYIITIDGIKCFHTGDIEDLNNVVRYNLVTQNIDLAFIVPFYLRDGSARNTLENWIGAKFLFPIHYQYTQPAFRADQILSNYPAAIIFSQELETWYMPPQ